MAIRAAKHARKALDHLTERSGGLSYYPSSVDQVQSVALEIAHQIVRTKAGYWATR